MLKKKEERDTVLFFCLKNNKKLLFDKIRIQNKKEGKAGTQCLYSLKNISCKGDYEEMFYL